MEAIKRLAAIDITTATTEQDLYVVPDAKAAVCKVVVCNRHNAAITYRLSHTYAGDAGSAAGAKDFLQYDTTLAANSSAEVKNISMSNADELRAYSSHTDVTFIVYGSEFDQTNVYAP